MSDNIGSRLKSDLMRDFNLSDAQASGFVGNLHVESGGFKTLQEITPMVKGSRGGYGYAQWTGPRRRAFEAWTASKRLAPTSYEANYGFLKHELENTSEGAVLRDLRQASDASVAAQIVSNKFLRPGIPHMSARIRQAQAAAGVPGTASTEPYVNPMGDPRDNPMSGANMPMPYTAPSVTEAPATTESPSLWEMQSAAWGGTNLPWMTRDKGSNTPDPTFNLASRLEQDTKEGGLDAERFSEFLGRDTIVNGQQYALQRESFSQNQSRLDVLQRGGLTGMALSVANSILDPVALGAEALAIAAMPASVGVVLGGKASRAGRALHGALVGGVAGAAGQAVDYAYNPNTTKADMLTGTILGFGVGGAIGALMKNPGAAQEAYALQAVARKAATDDAVMAAGSSVGAAQVPSMKTFLNDEGFEFLTNDDVDRTFAGAARIDLFASVDKSNIPAARALISGLVQDGAGKKTRGKVNTFAASEEKDLFKQQQATTIHRTYNPALREFAKGNPGVGRDALETRFNEDIDTYVRDTRIDRDQFYPAPVKRVGDQMTRQFTDALGEAQNPFLKEGLVGRPIAGFESVKQNRNYMPRFYDGAKVRTATNNMEQGEMERWVRGAILSANADIEEKLLARLSKGMTTGIINRANGLDDLAIRSLGDIDIDDLADEVLGLSKADKTALGDYLNGKVKSGGNKDARAKRRVLLDETYRLDGVKMKTGVMDEKGFGLDDLIMKDALGSFSQYMDHIAGARALARYRFRDPVSGELLVDGITSDREWETLIGKVRKQAADMNARGEKHGDVEMTVRRLNFAYSHIRGRPVSDWEKTNTGWWARSLRKYNYSRIMNQVGFAQVSEVGNILGQLGVKAAFSQMPAFRRISNMKGETILKSGLADDLETLIGAGTDRLNHGTDYRFDDMTGLREVNDSAWKNRADKLLNKGNRITSEISGMTQANIILERWTAGAIVQKFANRAAKGKGGLSPDRMADLGVDDAMSARITKMFNDPKNLEFTKGTITGKKVSRLHMDRWSDKEAASAFTNAAFRLSREIVQRNDIGNMSMWMSSPMAKVLMQFRSFMVGSYTKQSLKSIKHRDLPAVMSLVFSAGLAALVYTTQAQLQAIGRSDREDFLDNRLSFQKVAAAGFARSAQSSIIPMMIDSAMAATGNDAWFGHTRTTGQVSDMLLGNPGTGLLFGDIPQASSGVVRGAVEGGYSQEEARALTRLAPFSNSLPAVMGLNALIGPALNLRERAPR